MFIKLEVYYSSNISDYTTNKFLHTSTFQPPLVAFTRIIYEVAQ